MLAFLTHNLSPWALKLPENAYFGGIRWYGVAYLASFLIVAWFLKYCATRGKIDLDAEQRASLLTHLILGVLIGGRLGYVILYDFANFCDDPIVLVRFWDGGIAGMSSHGGFVGCMAALYFFCRKNALALFSVGDLLCAIAPAGLLLGRLANFINGELYGRITHVPWAVIFPSGGPCPRHPSQIYEALGEGLLLLVFAQWRYWRTRLHVGQLSAEFFILYGFVRIIVEYFREPDSSLIFFLTKGQFYSLFLIVFGIVLRGYVTRLASSALTKCASPSPKRPSNLK